MCLEGECQKSLACEEGEPRNPSREDRATEEVLGGVGIWSKESDLSISLLARNKDKRTKDWVNFTRSDIFDEDLQDQIENAIQCVDNDKTVPRYIIEGESEVAGPSGINNNRRVKKPMSKSNLVKVIIDDKEVDLRLEPSLTDPNEKDTPVAVHPSPIKVSAEKDSQELSLNIDPGVHCTRLRLAPTPDSSQEKVATTRK